MNPAALVEFLKSKEADLYFGRSFLLRAEVLARHFSGEGTLKDIAAKHGVTRAALTRHARKAREIFPTPVNIKLTASLEHGTEDTSSLSK